MAGRGQPNRGVTYSNECELWEWSQFCSCVIPSPSNSERFGKKGENMQNWLFYSVFWCKIGKFLPPPPPPPPVEFRQATPMITATSLCCFIICGLKIISRISRKLGSFLLLALICTPPRTISSIEQSGGSSILLKRLVNSVLFAKMIIFYMLLTVFKLF